MSAAELSRRAVLMAGLLVPTLLLTDQAKPETMAAKAPMKCADFLATLGVNTHLRFAGSQYNDVDAVQRALDYCGIRHLRDTAISAQAPNAGHYTRLAAAGARFCLFWGTGRAMADAINQIGALEAGHPGAVEYLEGPNEIQPRFAYAGLAGIAAGQKFMADLKAAASANPHLHGKPIVSFSSFIPAASSADIANHHPYPKAGAQPGELIRLRHDQWVGASGPMAGRSMVFTEFGYHTLVGEPVHAGHWQGIDEDTQAILILNGLLDAAAAGVSRCYIYQLSDGSADRPGQPSQENHFGLFDSNGRPKPAATAIRNLRALLADGAVNGRVALPALRISAESPVNSLALHDAAGRSYLAAWREEPVWDARTRTRLRVQPLKVPLVVSPQAAINGWTICDRAPIAISRQRGDATFMLGAEPALIRLG